MRHTTTAGMHPSAHPSTTRQPTNLQHTVSACVGTGDQASQHTDDARAGRQISPRRRRTTRRTTTRLVTVRVQTAGRQRYECLGDIVRNELDEVGRRQTTDDSGEHSDGVGQYGVVIRREQATKQLPGAMHVRERLGLKLEQSTQVSKHGDRCTLDSHVRTPHPTQPHTHTHTHTHRYA